MEINTETAKLIQREKSLSYLDGICSGLKFANSCKDAISKASVYEILGNLMAIPYELDRPITEKDISESMDEINALPPVLPMYQQGKWIKGITHEKCDCFGDRVKVANYTCSECGRVIKDIAVDDSFANNIKDYPYCHCGSRNEVEMKNE